MKYLNLGTALYQTEPFMRATEAQGWAWFKLISYCHQQMNGGKIVNCIDWPDGFWHNIGVSREVVMAESPLFRVSGLVLHVHFYNREREDGCKKQIAGGAKGGKAKAKNALKKRRLSSYPTSLPRRPPSSLPPTKERKKEGIPTPNGQIAHTP